MPDRIDGDWPRGFEEHRRAQLLAMARESTPEQRFQYLEEMLALFGPHIKDRQFRQRALPQI